jgi:hypothetical protein
VCKVENFIKFAVEMPWIKSFFPPEFIVASFVYGKPKVFLTIRCAILLNSCRFSLHILDASTLAGDSSFGSANIETTDRRIFSTDCTGDHLSELDSYPSGSSPGEWRIEIQTRPSGKMFG